MVLLQYENVQDLLNDINITNSKKKIHIDIDLTATTFLDLTFLINDTFKQLVKQLFSITLINLGNYHMYKFSWKVANQSHCSRTQRLIINNKHASAHSTKLLLLTCCTHSLFQYDFSKYELPTQFLMTQNL